MDEALRPTFSATSQADIEAIEEQEQIIDEVTESIASLAYHGGFQSIRADLENTIQDLRTHKYPKIKIGTKDDFEAIGRKTVVADLAASILEGVLQQVDNAIEATENGKGE